MVTTTCTQYISYYGLRISHSHTHTHTHSLTITDPNNRSAWVTGEDVEEEEDEVFSLTHKLPLLVESTKLSMVDNSASVSGQDRRQLGFSLSYLERGGGVDGSEALQTWRAS